MPPKREPEAADEEQPEKQTQRPPTRGRLRAVMPESSNDESDYLGRFDVLWMSESEFANRGLKALNTSFTVATSEDQIIPAIEGDRT